MSSRFIARSFVRPFVRPFVRSSTRAFAFCVSASAAALALLAPSAALAVPVTYTYVGKPFTTITNPALGQHVTASVTFTSAFNPLGEVKGSTDILAWTLSTETVSFSSTTVGLLNSGAVFNYQKNVGMAEWSMQVVANGMQLLTAKQGTSSNDYISNGISGNLNQYTPGTWTVSATPPAVPEPGAVVLMGLGLAAVALRVGKHKRVAG